MSSSAVCAGVYSSVLTKNRPSWAVSGLPTVLFPKSLDLAQGALVREYPVLQFKLSEVLTLFISCKVDGLAKSPSTRPARGAQINGKPLLGEAPGSMTR
ncbi:MAG: hypothetical protein RRA32_07390, partial [bacterium]|nr:hypothetical protein [bacterium]